ncbi:metallophosphoesterase [Bibersteinia trehalosi]|uniref:Metallophosphoesterase n=1 Tax=Bibersteinia trehalosi TaxID=47735 RepID=A0A426FJ31_BIBTR|nr:metallophosphoesterase [Bibersteinia trehalosi]RRN04583.1 metallophosphoesterase [Bibersteinia trehalosi]
MEFRYIIINIVAITSLQLLIFCLVRTLSWLFGWQKSTRKKVGWTLYLGINSILLVPFLTPYKIFRPMAFILVFLWFAFLISLATLTLNKLSGWRLNALLRKVYPVAYLGLIGFALFNAYVPQAVHFSVKIDKPLKEPIRIGVASDTHLGILFGAKQLDKLAEIFQQEKVDLILMPGDIMDDDTLAYEAENMQPSLSKLAAPLGVYATLGNHDFFGQQQAIYQSIEQAGIKVLWDQAVEIDGKFVIIGRNDDLYRNRPTAEQILHNVNTALPIFLMDHRPTDIATHSQLPIDIQVSGHTHNGQIFPANFIVKMLNRLSYGYEKIGLGHYFVTSGYGFWGVPMRLGSRSEVFIIDVEGQR